MVRILSFFDCSDSKTYRCFFCGECGEQYLVRIHCNERTCPNCNRYRSQTLRDKYSKFGSWLNNSFFLTLTVRNVEKKVLRDGISHLRNCIGRLFRRAPYRRFIAGGIYSIEVKPDNNGRINLHAHLCVDSAVDFQKCGWYYRYNTKSCRLAKDWKSITGDSWYVHWEKTRYPDSAIAYCLKYLTKETDFGDYDTEVLINEQLSGTRLISTFGVVYHMNFEKSKFLCSCGAINSLTPVGYEILYDESEAKYSMYDEFNHSLYSFDWRSS